MKVIIEKYDKPILENSFSKFNFWRWDSLWAYHPCVLEWKGKYYLFYTGKSIKRKIAHRIGLAQSSDLAKWTKVKNPVLKEGKDGDWDSDFVAHAFVFREGNKFYMLYDGSKKGHWLEEIGLAQSSDLLNWKKYSKNPIFRVSKNWWESRHVSRCFVFKEKGLYYLYYAGHDGKRERIGVAIGKSIFNLKKFEEPVLDIGAKGSFDEKSISDPRILKYNKEYLMFYSAIDADGVERIGLAKSSNLLNWKKYSKNPIFDVSKNAWDAISGARMDVKKIKNKLYIFYSGRRKYFYKIGLAKLFLSNNE